MHGLLPSEKKQQEFNKRLNCPLNLRVLGRVRFSQRLGQTTKNKQGIWLMFDGLSLKLIIFHKVTNTGTSVNQNLIKKDKVKDSRRK